MKRRLALTLALCVALAACGGQAEEKTKGAQRAENEAFLRAHVVSLIPQSDGVALCSDGQLGLTDGDGAWQREFHLGKGDRFRSQADEHASSIFEVTEIKPDMIVVKYMSRFDHASFGKNLVTVDEGEVAVRFVKK